MGKNKKTFVIYKIRTLKQDAEKKFCSKILGPDTNFEVVFGKFLRKTRIDELPQLVNILKGEMNFIGPRPVRASIYLKKQRLFLDYDIRFRVKPGLIGPSQILTPATSPLRLRAIIDNRYVRLKEKSSFSSVKFVIFAFCALVSNFFQEINLSFKGKWQTLKGRGCFRDLRCSKRITGHKVNILLTNPFFKPFTNTNISIIDINHKTMCVKTDQKLEDRKEFFIIIEVLLQKKKKIKRIKCKVVSQVMRSCNLKDTLYIYIIHYKPISELNRYMLQQYVLKQSIF